MTKIYSKYSISKLLTLLRQNDTGVLGTTFSIRLGTLLTPGREMTLSFWQLQKRYVIIRTQLGPRAILLTENYFRIDILLRHQFQSVWPGAIQIKIT